MDDNQARYTALLLKTNRRQKGWSQESVCKGICAVSYYSKIESGNVIPAISILQDLAKALEMELPEFQTEEINDHEFLKPSENRRTKQKAEKTDTRQETASPTTSSLSPREMAVLWQRLRSGHIDEVQKQFSEKLVPGFFHGSSRTLPDPNLFDSSHPCSLDVLLFMGLFQLFDLFSVFDPEELNPCLNNEQKAICSLIAKDFDRATFYCQEGWVQLIAAFGLYQSRQSDYQVLIRLEKAYTQAAKEGYPYLMATISHIMGIVCANVQDHPAAKEYFHRAFRLFIELDDEDSLDQLRYNLGCLALEEGNSEQALALLEQVKHPSVMDLHKQMICLEWLNRKEEALQKIGLYKQADYVGWNPKLIDQIFELSKIRLSQEDWVHQPAYGKLLLDVYQELAQTDTHKGFAQFHLPWVIQYLKANRQYAKAAAILENFPGKPQFILPEAS